MVHNEFMSLVHMPATVHEASKERLALTAHSNEGIYSRWYLG